METPALVIETSTPHASIAWVDETGLIENHSFQSDRHHNALLFDPLAKLLKNRPSLRIILVGSGPGSYSGTRVGIAAAQGVAIAMNCPAVAVPSILAAPMTAAGAACLAIGDARRGSFWTARIVGRELVEDPGLCVLAELTQRISKAAASGQVVFSFEEAARFPLPNELSMLIRTSIPDAGLLWSAWCASDEKTRLNWSAVIPQPLYLKPPHITPARRPWLIRP
jgi:tRNA threonylcarbamoyl adenosine modification protein YeaZ